jgi:hypothetical protein
MVTPSLSLTTGFTGKYTHKSGICPDLPRTLPLIHISEGAGISDTELPENLGLQAESGIPAASWIPVFFLQPAGI